MKCKKCEEIRKEYAFGYCKACYLWELTTDDGIERIRYLIHKNAIQEEQGIK